MTTSTSARIGMASPATGATGATGASVATLTTTVDTAIGPFTVIAVDRGPDPHDGTDHGPNLRNGTPAVIASGWTDDISALLPLIAPALRPATVAPVSEIPGITELVVAYHEGDLTAVDAVAVRQDSGPFLELLWDTLRAVQPGEAVTYTELAGRAGRARAARAAGSACSRNAAALFVPCHRVVPATGGVGGFRWGPEVKQWLLRHEEQNS